MYSNNNKNPGYLTIEEVYSYLDWIFNIYGNPNSNPSPSSIEKMFNFKQLITYNEFIDFIEPFY